MKKIIFVMLSLALSQLAWASETHIFCPEPSSIRFEVNNPVPGSWNHYRIYGFAKVMGNFPSFLMDSYSDQNTPATELFGASYIYDGTLVCDYYGRKNHSFVLDYGDLREHFKQGCAFKYGDHSECDGSVEHCELVCKT